MTQKTKFAVIGSNSFSGAWFVDLLLEDKTNDVIGLSRSQEKKAIFLPYKSRKNASFEFYQLDLNRDMKKIIGLFDDFQPDYVVNFAAQSEVLPSWSNPEHWFQTNALSIVSLTNQLKDKKYLKRYVHISSPEVYGTCEGTVYESAPLNPSTPYAASKAAGDLFMLTLVNNFKFPLIMTRATNVYGKCQQLFKIIPRTVIYLKLGKMIELHGGGMAVKSYIHIRDVCTGTLKAALLGKPGSIYHLSPDRGYAVRDVVETLCDLMGYDFEKSTVTVGERLGQDARYVIDSTKIRKELDWKPVISLEQGLKEVVGWVESNWTEIKKEPLEYIHKP